MMKVEKFAGGGGGSWRKSRNNKWQLLYLVAEKLFVSLHGCFLRGSSWAILVSFSACALALAWQTKHWGASSVIAEGKFHSPCDIYLKKKWILALRVKLKAHTTLWRFLLNRNWPMPLFYLFFLTHMWSCGHCFFNLHSWAKIGCSQSKLGQTGAGLWTTRPCKGGCMKQVQAEGEQRLWFPRGLGGEPWNTLQQKAWITCLLSGALLWFAVEPPQYSNPVVVLRATHGFFQFFQSLMPKITLTMLLRWEFKVFVVFIHRVLAACL